MKKIIALVAAVVVLLVLFFWWHGKSGSNTQMAEEGNGSPNALPTEKPGETGMVASIKDAMGLGTKMQCTYTSEANSQSFQSSVVVDGEKFMSTSVTDDMTTYGLFDGETQYTWTSKDNKGFKMSKACLNELKGMAHPTTEGSNVPKTEDLETGLDAAKNVSCTPATGVDFTLPSDIVFTDQCVLMKQSMDMMNKLKDKMPAATTVPTMPSGY